MSQIRQTVSGKSKFVSVSKSNIQTLEIVQTASAQTGKLFEEPNKSAQKSETASRKFNLLYYASWLPLSRYHHAISQTVSAKSELRFKEPQKRAELKNNAPQRTQRAQSAGIFKIFLDKTVTPRRRTRMTRIARIFADLRASASTVTPVDCVHTYASALAYVDVYSAQSVFYGSASAFIRVHLRLAESNITPQSTQRAQSMAAVIFASFVLFAVRFINSLNELSSIAQPSVFIGVYPRLIDWTAPAEGR